MNKESRKSKLYGAESMSLTISAIVQMNSRDKRWSMYKECDLPEQEFERSMGFFIRGSFMAMFLFIAEIYKRIVPILVYIFDLGTYSSSGGVLSENNLAKLLSVHEKNNHLGHLAGNHKIAKVDATIKVNEYPNIYPSFTMVTVI